MDKISSNNQFMEPVEAKGGQLVVLYLKLKNIGQESGDMMWTKFQVIDDQGRKYDAIKDFKETLSIDMWLKEHSLEQFSSQMFPGETIETAKVFRVAPDASELKLIVNGKSLNIGSIA